MDDALSRSVHAILRDAAERAILPRYRKLAAEQITAKAADDVVTVADQDSEALLTEALARLLPDAAVVGEEAAFADPSVFERLDQGLCWIVDPLDGTSNFAAGKPPFGIIVALAEAGETVAGWLYDPLSGRFCATTRGRGAWIDGERITARSTGEQPPVAAISLLFTDPPQREAVMTHIAPHFRLVDIPRCAAEQYPRLVLGQNDLALFNRALPWDHAAGVLFVEEAGGKVARPDGSPYRVADHARPGLIGAASPALWDGMATRIEALRAAG